MTILTGIGEYIGKLFSVEPKPIDDSLEEKINKALAEEREKIRPSREDIDDFSWVTKDNNPIHRIPKRAKKLGFNDIPLMGAHVAAYGEQFMERVVEHMKEYWGAEIKIIGQDNHFKSAVYPGERILWQVVGYKKRDGEIELNAEGKVKDKKAIDITTKLGNRYYEMPQIAGPIYYRRYLIEEEHLETFYNCVGGKSNGKVPKILPSAFVPATLLSLLEEKTQSMEGANLSMDFNFLEEPEIGRLQVDIFPAREPKQRGDYYLYKFKTVCSQKTNPIVYGGILSSTKNLIKFDL